MSQNWIGHVSKASKWEFLNGTTYDRKKPHSKVASGYLILLFSLFLLLFMGPTALFDIIHESYCTILAKFYLYLQYFQQKVFNFSKINGSQTDP